MTAEVADPASLGKNAEDMGINTNNQTSGILIMKTARVQSTG